MSNLREIPGYYYDAQKGKYFRIQPDHRAPPGAAHSSSAVAASRLATERANALTARQQREQAGRIKRISPSTYSNLNLRLRHGDRNSKDLLAQHYASTLQCRTAEADQETFLEALTLTDGEIYSAFRVQNPDQIRFYCLNEPCLQAVTVLHEVPHVRQRRPRIGIVEGGSSNLAAYIGTCDSRNCSTLWPCCEASTSGQRRIKTMTRFPFCCQLTSRYRVATNLLLCSQ